MTKHTKNTLIVLISVAEIVMDVFCIGMTLRRLILMMKDDDAS